MPYRAPRYSHLHAARDVGVAAIDLDGDAAAAGFPIDNLIDDRQGTIFKTSTAVSGLNIDIDLGLGFVTGISRLILPPGPRQGRSSTSTRSTRARRRSATSASRSAPGRSSIFCRRSS